MKILEAGQSAGYQTNLVARLFTQAVYRELRPLGIFPGQLPVFFALAGGRVLSQKTLAQGAGMEQPTMAGTLARMCKDGLVGRQPDPADGRSVLYSLTPVAMEKLGAVRAAVAAVNARALSGLSGVERRQYLEFLGKIAGALSGS